MQEVHVHSVNVLPTMRSTCTLEEASWSRETATGGALPGNTPGAACAHQGETCRSRVCSLSLKRTSSPVLIREAAQSVPDFGTTSDGSGRATRGSWREFCAALRSRLPELLVASPLRETVNETFSSFTTIDRVQTESPDSGAFLSTGASELRLASSSLNAALSKQDCDAAGELGLLWGSAAPRYSPRSPACLSRKPASLLFACG